MDNIKQIDNLEAFKRLVVEKSQSYDIDQGFAAAAEKYDIQIPSSYPSIVAWNDKDKKYSFWPIETQEDVDTVIRLLKKKISELQQEKNKLETAMNYQKFLESHQGVSLD